MPFLSFMKALDDLLYEVMSWLAFFPITLWRVIVRPLKTMDYADSELRQDAALQYDETLSPPQFLLVALIISHGLELYILGQSEIVTKRVGLAGLVKDDTSLLGLRLILFSIFPLVFAIRLVRLKGMKLTRDSLRDPFYAQCFAVAPFALALGIATLGMSAKGWQGIASVSLLVSAIIWFVAVQYSWFFERLREGKLAAMKATGSGFLQSIFLFVLASAFVV